MTDAQILAIILSIIPCFAVALIAGRFIIPWLRAMKAGQTIREIGPSWHQSKTGTPAMGGLIFILTSLIGVAVLGLVCKAWSSTLIFAFALIFGAIGFLDDYKKVKKKQNEGLTASQKFLLQLAASALYLYILYRIGHLSSSLWIPFTGVRWSIPIWIYIPFAVFVIVGTVNAVNLTDGIDGLATGVTMPLMIFFLVTALALKKAELAIFPAALLGGLAGFLCYNFHPAKTFMGDTGSLFLGGAVCGLAFALDMPLILVLVGLIYIIETLSVIIQTTYFKATHGKRVFKMAPIHHHFEMCGWSEVKIWTVFTAVSIVMCVIAYLSTAPLR
ncbi:MAG: phospho-N-acetylmuramoyl-pentapeptide-transferase [Oscillospiraceae bacterium]|nr:phospho-N-acetylmuramoyl-pentapeptide-transferase [Oscillospiraceae bacterium]MBR7010944.1 phospho-N-acetylmuramoyl-pentapeptide-transferase [Oscillospiraceae bacterium]